MILFKKAETQIYKDPSWLQIHGFLVVILRFPVFLDDNYITSETPALASTQLRRVVVVYKSRENKN